MGSEQDITLGEIARAVGRIEKKVDDQGETITAVNLRLTAIEAQRPPGAGKMVGIGGAGAALAFVGDWLMQHFKGGGTP